MPHIINGVKCRTREESLKHIIKQAKAEKIGPNGTTENTGHAHDCQYQYPSGNNCAVGALFSKRQLNQIKKQGMNGMSVAYLATSNLVGKRNLETVTGMKLSELEVIQKIHDETLQNHNIEAARQGVIRHCEMKLQELNAKSTKK